MNVISKPLMALASLSGLVALAGIAVAKDPPILSLSMEHFRDTATLKDDALDTTATITTEPGFIEHQGLLRFVTHDTFLRGFINKKTGEATTQVYEWITYDGDWRFYETANFSTLNGPVSAPATQIDKQVDACSTLSCTHTEHVAFTIPEAYLRALAAAYVPGKPAIWLYKFIPKAGPDFTDGLSNAEVAGFIAKIDDYTAAHRLAVPSKQTLGVLFAPMSPTPDNSARTGLLVIQVKDGSIAQNAGIAVGDIIRAFGDAQITQPTDLQAAVAAATPGSSVQVKLLRAATDMMVTAKF